jgi:type VI secretion system secreted protein Hcp
MYTVSEKVLIPFIAMVLLLSMVPNPVSQQLAILPGGNVQGIWEDLFGSDSKETPEISIVSNEDAASDMFLQITGIDGESIDTDHRAWIDVLSFSMGMSQPWDGSVGIGQIIMEDIVLVKQVDKATPKLMEKCAKGEHIPSVILEVSNVGETKHTYYKYELKNVIVSSFYSKGDITEKIPTETFTLHFEWFKVTYSEIDNTGNLMGNVEFTWDTVLGRVG